MIIFYLIEFSKLYSKIFIIFRNDQLKIVYSTVILKILKNLKTLACTVLKYLIFDFDQMYFRF